MKSLKNKTLSLTDAAALHERAKTPYVQKMLSNISTKIDGGYDVDVLFYDTTLTADRDFKDFWRGTGSFVFLYVCGDLIVDGVFQDSGGEPETIVVIEGDLKARNLVTSGFLEVHGNLEVEESIAGVGNDCNAKVFGDLRASVLHTGEHYFEVDGTADVDFAHEPRIKVSNTLPTMEDEEWAEKLDPDLFDGGEDDGEWWLDYIDERKVAQRIGRGGSIFKT